MIMLSYLPFMWKAVSAFITTLTFEYGLVQVDGITWGEHGYVLGTAAAVAFGVWVVENKKVRAQNRQVVEPPTSTW